MPILNYTTKVSDHKTVSEIQAVLSRKGATSVSVLYKDGDPDAVSFCFKMGDRETPFKLPCKFEGVRKVLLAEIKAPALRKKRERDKEFAKQTRRVAWRIIKDWVEAQLALIEAGQAEVDEVFLPYLMAPNGDTLYKAFSRNAPKFLAVLDAPLALPAPGDRP